MATVTALEPRRLDFKNVGEISKEADRLLAGGYDRAGSWDLPQVCNHLSDGLTLSMSSGIKPMVPFFVRWYIKWRYLDKALQARRLPRNVKAPSEIRLPPSGDPAAAVARLRDAVARFDTFRGEFHPHPYFGRLDREQARQFHLIHCAHHLSFLIPRA